MEFSSSEEEEGDEVSVMLRDPLPMDPRLREAIRQEAARIPTFGEPLLWQDYVARLASGRFLHKEALVALHLARGREQARPLEQLLVQLTAAPPLFK